MRAIGFSVQDLKSHGFFSAQELKDVNVAAADMRAAGFTLPKDTSIESIFDEEKVTIE